MSDVSFVLFWAMALGYAAVALSGLLPHERLVRALAGAGMVAGGVAGVSLATVVLWSGESLDLVGPALFGLAGGETFRVDRLGAVFLAIISGVAVPVGIYGASYVRSYAGRYSTRWMSFTTGGFLLSMSLLVSSASVFTFALCWELMAVSSFFLVLTEHDRDESVRAALWYAAMTHAGLLAVLAAFYLMGEGGTGQSFDALRHSARLLPAGARNAVFLLALAGFGSKAGIVPLHVWLPRAHPAAPSHISALMSAAMVKLGIYGLLRVGLDLLGGGPAWWGTVIIVCGAVTALTGVLYALVEDDLKRLLAYSTVENVGLILLGVGAGFLFQSLGQADAAMLAFAAALLHAVNHASFKTTLFLAAGSIVHASGTRNMNLLGGLVKRTPWTAAAFLIGTVSIAALPPFNGFVSEWLLFQAFLSGVARSQSSMAALLTLGVGALALTGGLAAATFVKAFGISCLAMPRSSAAAEAHESPRLMRAGMLIAAVTCPLLALFTVPLVSTLTGSLGSLAGLPATRPAFTFGATVRTGHSMAAISPVAIAIVLAGVIALAWLAVRALSRRRVHLGDTWGCGRIGQTPRMEYTSSAFAEPLRRVFSQLYRPAEDTAIGVAHEDSPYFIQSVKYQAQLHPWFQRSLYGPLVDLVEAAGARTRRLQSGSVNAYVGYLVLALVVLLVMVIGF